MNSTSITHFHRHLPHHLHGEAGNRRRKRGNKKKKENRKRKENREKREKKDKKKRERGRAEKAIRRILSKARKNTEARATTPPAQHAFIAIIFVISRESISRRRENKQRPKPAWPICFAVPGKEKGERRTEKKGKRREENREGEERRKRQAT
ncbi:hypothetical protein NC652_004005 [Populus alba x Populus x berolinensis]|nr:hypothetical protein NC652_004005 [Populus alba x Populus x berolinensis]